MGLIMNTRTMGIFKNVYFSFGCVGYKLWHMESFIVVGEFLSSCGSQAW